MADRATVVTLAGYAVIALVALVVLAAVLGSVAGLDDHVAATEARGTTVYGTPVDVVRSDVCMDTCALTAVPEDRRRHDILRVLDRCDCWRTEFAVYKATVGLTDDGLAAQLAREGLIERRTDREALAPVHEYRYIGPDGKYDRRLSDAALEQRLVNYANVSGTWYRVGELAESVPVPHDRVEAALDRLVDAGRLERATPLLTAPQYAHPRVDHAPPGGLHGPGRLLPVLLVVLVAVVIVGLVQRWRTRPATE